MAILAYALGSCAFCALFLSIVACVDLTSDLLRNIDIVSTRSLVLIIADGIGYWNEEETDRQMGRQVDRQTDRHTNNTDDFTGLCSC